MRQKHLAIDEETDTSFSEWKTFQQGTAKTLCYFVKNTGPSFPNCMGLLQELLNVINSYISSLQRKLIVPGRIYRQFLHLYCA